MLNVRTLRQPDQHMREILRGASLALVLKVSAAAIGFLYVVTLGRLLGAESTGFYFMALTVATIAATLGKVGMENPLVRFTASHAAKREWEQVKGVFTRAMLVALVVSATMALLMHASAPLLAERVFEKPDLESALRWMSLAVVPLALATLSANGLKGLKRVGAFVFVFSMAIPLFALIALMQIGSEYGVAGAVWAYTLGVLAAMICGLILYGRSVRTLFRGVRGGFPIPRLLASGWPLLLSNLMNLMVNWSAILFLGYWSTVQNVGVFGAAFRTSFLITFVLMAVNSVSAPKFAELFGQGDLDSLRRVVRMSTRLLIISSLPVTLVFVVFATPIMGLFGEDFTGGGPVLVILALGQLINVVSGSVLNLLAMSGNEKRVRDSLYIAVAVNLLLSVFLIPAFGILGAAVATALTLAVKNLVAVYFLYRRVGISTLPF